MVKKYKINNKVLFFCILLSVLLLTKMFFTWYSKRASKEVINIAEANTNKYLQELTTDYSLLSRGDFTNQISVTKNNLGEISHIHYNLSSLYYLTNQYLNRLKCKINEESTHNLLFSTKKKDYFIIWIPLGIVSHSIYLNNLGPKIPVIIYFVPTLFSEVKTKVTNYGLNNALLEVCLEIKINYEVLSPFKTENKDINYEIPLSSEVIAGRVPEIYGGSLESSSGHF